MAKKKSKKKKSEGWKKFGMTAERERMKKIVALLSRRASEAKKRGHPVHAKRMGELAKLASREYKRLAKIHVLGGSGESDFGVLADALEGDMADLGEPEGRRFGFGSLLLAVAAGFVIGRAAT